MRMTMFAAAAALLALASCAGPRKTPEQIAAEQREQLHAAWSKPDAKPGEIDADDKYCTYDADKANLNYHSSNMFMPAIHFGELYRECMAAKGWEPTKK